MSINVPPTLRGIGHYVKIAQEYQQRDIVIYYWALYYAVNAGMKIDRNSKESMEFLATTLGDLEKIKKANHTRDEITQDVVAQAYIENHALQLFNFADQKDRASDFGKNVVKAFYTAGHLFDILTTFGELDDGLEKARKYSKWKATYIHNCLKNGETPVAGPPGGDQQSQQQQQPPSNNSLDTPPPVPSMQDFGFSQHQQPQNTNVQPHQPPHGGYSTASYPDAASHGGYHQGYGFQQQQQPQYPTPHHQPTPPPRPSVQPNAYHHQQQQPHQPNVHPGMPPTVPASSSSHGNVVTSASAYKPASDLKLEDYIEARKFLKFAMSAIDYEDAPAAIENMLKSIKVLQKQPPT